jgi:hypothetical protein
MSLTKDEHSIDIDGHRVEVTGKTGPVHATWVLAIDGQEADSAKAAGDFVLRAELPDGPPVEVAVHQSLVGPTRVSFRRGGEEIHSAQGYVA